MQRNSLLCGMSLRKIQVAQYQTASRNSSVPSPTMTSHARWTTLACRYVGRSSSGNELSPWITVAVPSVGSDSHEAKPGIGMPPTTSPSELRWPNSVSGTSLRRLGHQLDGGELHRLVVVDPAGERVADAHLDRDGDGRDGERDEEAQPVVPVAAAAQHADGVDRRRPGTRRRRRRRPPCAPPSAASRR